MIFSIFFLPRVIPLEQVGVKYWIADVITAVCIGILKRNELKIRAMEAAIHGAAERRITTVDDLFDVFHDNRSGFYIVFDYFIIISKNLLYHIHKTIMEQNDVKRNLQFSTCIHQFVIFNTILTSPSHINDHRGRYSFLRSADIKPQNHFSNL